MKDGPFQVQFASFQSLGFRAEGLGLPDLIAFTPSPISTMMSGLSPDTHIFFFSGGSAQEVKFPCMCLCGDFGDVCADPVYGHVHSL